MLEKRLGFRDGLAADDLGHQRSGCRGDGTARSFERDLDDAITVHLQIEPQLITAQRVITLGEVIGLRLRGVRPEVPLELLERYGLGQLPHRDSPVFRPSL